GRAVALHGRAVGDLYSRAVSGDFLAGVSGEAEVAAWIQSIGRGHGTAIEHIGGYDPGHPRRKGVCAGRAGSGAVSAGQSAFADCEQSAERDLVVLWTTGIAAHGHWPDGRMGVWGVVDLPHRLRRNGGADGRHADRVRRLDDKVLRPHGNA